MKQLKINKTWKIAACLLAMLFIQNIMAYIEPPFIPYKTWYSGTSYQNLWGVNTAGNYGTQLVESRCDSAYYFDGVDDYMTTVMDAIGTNDFAISFWIKTTDTDVTLLDSYYNEGIEVKLVNGKPQFFMKVTGNYSYLYHTASINVADNKWHHILVSVDRDQSNGIQIFVDGTQRGSGNPTVQNGNLPSSTLYIGNPNYWPAANRPYFNGLMDDIKIFHKTMLPNDSWITGTCPLTSLANLSTHFNGDNFTDQISGGTATNLSGTELYPNGRCGSAYKFDGIYDPYSNDRMTHNIDGPGAGDFTISLWVQTEDTHATLVDSYYGAGFRLLLDGGKPRFTLYAPGDYYSTIVTSSLSVADGQWHHITVSVDRDNPNGVQIHVDGVETGTGDPTDEIGVLYPNTMTVGAPKFWPAPNPAYLDGLMDDIKIFHTIRTPAEIMETETCPMEAEGNTLNHYNGNDYNNQTGFQVATPFGDAHIEAGRCDSAYAFDGDWDYMTTELEGPGTGDFTISLWFKDTYTDVTLPEISRTLLDNNINGDGITIQLTAGHIAFRMYTGFGPYAHEPFITGLTQITDSQWHHIVISVDRDDPNGIRIYVDGKLDATGNPTNQNGDLTTKTTYIGTPRTWGAPNRPHFTGYIDDIKTFTTALKPEEVNQAETCPGDITQYTCEPYMDIMVLQDLTGSISQILYELYEHAFAFFGTVTDNSPNSSLGMGSFKDNPYQPNINSADYVYQTHQPLTQNGYSFATALHGHYPSGGGPTLPESSLDAMHMAARRMSEVGYRNGSDRTIMVITDALWQESGDCSTCTVMNNGDGVLDSLEDYVSVQQLADALIDADVRPVFIVPTNLVSDYEVLVNDLETLGTRAGDVVEIQFSYGIVTSNFLKLLLEGAGCEIQH